MVLLCGHMDLMDFRSGSVVLDLWFQSRLVSASPMRLMSRWLMLDRFVARSDFVGFNPLQFWKTIRIVLCGHGSGGSLLAVWRVPFGVVWSFVGKGGCDGG